MKKKSKPIKRSDEWYANEIKKIDAKIERRNKRKNQAWRNLLDKMGIQ